MEANKNHIVSIIIVSYNNFHLLEDCLNSVANYLKSVEYEIILIDNNSTEAGLDELLSKYNSIKIIKNSENLGFSKANNQGYKIAEGRYLLLLNADTQFTSNILSDMLEFIEQSPVPVIAAPKLLYPDGRFQDSAYKFPSIWRLISSNFFLEKIFGKIDLFNKYYLKLEAKNSPIAVDSVIGAFMLMKKETYSVLDGFDENFFFYHEDTDLCFRFKKLGGNVLYFPHLSLIHVGGGSTNQIKWFQLKNKVTARIKYFNKHKSKLYLLFVFILEFSGNLIRGILFFILGLLLPGKEYLYQSKLYFKAIEILFSSK